MSIVPVPSPDWLLKLALAAAKQLSDLAPQIKAQLEGNLIPLDFAVFGYRGTGKTTFLNFMRFGIPTEPPPTPSMEELDPFQIYVVGRRPVKVAGIYDVSGEEWKVHKKSTELTWPLWEEIFLRQTPRGIIFMVDHESLKQSKAALRYVINMIKRSDPPMTFWQRLFGGRQRQIARKNLKVFMLLVNKLDQWEKRSLTKGKILADYAEEIQDLHALITKNGGKYYQDEISAKDGTNCERAIQNFVLGLLAVSSR